MYLEPESGSAVSCLPCVHSTFLHLRWAWRGRAGSQLSHHQVRSIHWTFHLSTNSVPVSLITGLLQVVPGIPLQTPGRSGLAWWRWVSWSTFVSDFNWPAVESSKEKFKQNSCYKSLMWSWVNCLSLRTDFIEMGGRVSVAVTDWLTSLRKCKQKIFLREIFRIPFGRKLSVREKSVESFPVKIFSNKAGAFGYLIRQSNK